MSIITSDYVTAFGYSPNTPNGGVINLWEAQILWTPLTILTTLELLSSSVNDAAAGTGARSILVEGLDANYTQISETIVPNGTTPVTCINQYLVLNAVTVLTVGSTGNNVGNITIRVQGDAKTQGYILAGANISRHGRYTVPVGYTWTIENFFFLSNKMGAAGNGSEALITPVIYSNGIMYQNLPITLSSGMGLAITVPTGFAAHEKQTVMFLISQVSMTGLNISSGISGVVTSNQ